MRKRFYQALKVLPILLGLFAFQLPAHSTPANPPLFHGIPYETFRVHTPDQANLALIRLKGNENGPPVMLSPGVVENAEALDALAASFHARGYRVYIGQVRFAGRGENRSQGSPHGLNGFEEAWKYDFPALVRFVHEDSDGKPVHLVGHSMGGILSMILLTQFAEEFDTKVAAVTTLGSPYEFKHLPNKIMWLVGKVLPALEFVRDRLNMEKIDWHLRGIDGLQKLKQSTRVEIRKSAIFIEKTVLKTANLILHAVMTDLNHVSDEGMEHFVQQEIAQLPIQFLIDFAKAAMRGGFYTRDGKRPLIDPNLIRKPFQVGGGEYDELVPVAELKNLYYRLGSVMKRLVIVRNMKHVTLVAADHETSDEYYRELVDFHDRLGNLVGIKIVTPQTFEQVFNDPKFLAIPRSYFFNCRRLLSRQ